MAAPSIYDFSALGSGCAFHFYDASVATANAVEDEVFRIEHRYSRYRTDSVLAEINRVAAAGGSLEIDDETAALLDYAYACHRKSGGLFDITTGILRRAWNFSSGRAPSPVEIAQWLPFVGLEKIYWERPKLSFPLAGVELDFGGIGKEYAADRAAAICADAGVLSGLIDLGGDIRVLGPRPDGTPWSICIRDPMTAGQSVASILIEAGGLATSGDYERCVMIEGQRYGHILNPHTGWPERGGLAGVSVVADTCLLAGSLSTIAILKGVGGAAWLAKLGVRAVWVDAEGLKGGT